MDELTLLCRCATTFNTAGGIDEGAFRALLQRFVDNRIGVYIASGGSGEGHQLKLEECARLYQLGVEVCKGRVIVGSNQPEQMTADETLAHAKPAIAAGVDICNIYGPATRHGYKCTNDEYLNYFREVFSFINYPVALCPNPSLGGYIPPWVIARLANAFPQVESINLSGISNDNYFLDLMELLDRPVSIYVPFQGSFHTLQLGATGLLGPEANFIPATFRRYLDLYAAGEFREMNEVYADIRRVTQFVSQWKGSTPRWIKLAFRGFKLPGGEGGIRTPYQLDPNEVERFVTGALRLNVPEIITLAEVAGVKHETIMTVDA